MYDKDEWNSCEDQKGRRRKEEEKNSKLYKTLGVLCGLALVIILI